MPTKVRHCAYCDHDRVPDRRCDHGRDVRVRRWRSDLLCLARRSLCDRCESAAASSPATRFASVFRERLSAISSVSCIPSRGALANRETHRAWSRLPLEAGPSDEYVRTLVEGRRRSRRDEHAESGSLPRKKSLGSSRVSRSSAVETRSAAAKRRDPDVRTGRVELCIGHRKFDPASSRRPASSVSLLVQALFVPAGHDQRVAVRAQKARVRDGIDASLSQRKCHPRIVDCAHRVPPRVRANARSPRGDHERLFEPGPRTALEVVQSVAADQELCGSIAAKKTQPQRSSRVLEFWRSDAAADRVCSQPTPSGPPDGLTCRRRGGRAQQDLLRASPWLAWRGPWLGRVRRLAEVPRSRRSR